VRAALAAGAIPFTPMVRREQIVLELQRCVERADTLFLCDQTRVNTERREHARYVLRQAQADALSDAEWQKLDEALVDTSETLS